MRACSRSHVTQANRWINNPRSKFSSRNVVLATAFLVTLIFSITSTAQWTIADTSGSVIVNGAARYTSNGYIGISNDLYFSSDSGFSWETRTPMYLNFPMLGFWTDAYFMSQNEGLMSGAYDYNNQYAITLTTDGGTTWTPVYNNSQGAWPRRINALHRPSPDTMYAAGTNGRVLRSMNGGLDWIALPSIGPQEITSLHFISPSTGLLAGENVLMRTTTSGANWTSTLPVTGKQVLAAAGNTFAACGPNAIHVSTNSGVDWITRPAPFTAPRSAHIFNATDFVVVDELIDALFITRSGGLYWEKAELPVVGDLQAVHFNDAQNGILVGKTGDRSMILRTTSGPGYGSPVISVASSSVPGCGSNTYTFEAVAADPAWSLVWYRDGEVIGSGTSVVVEYTSSGPADVELRAGNGIFSSSHFVNTSITVDQPFSVQAIDDMVLCYGGTATLGVQGAPLGATYSWSPSTGLSSTSIADPTLSDLPNSITYIVTAQYGSCTAIDSVYVEQQPIIEDMSWSSMFTGDYSLEYEFPDTYNGFVISDMTIHVTHDGGLTWTPRPIEAPGFQELDRLTMLDPLHGYVSHVYFLLETRDGWQTYTTVNNNLLIHGNYRKRVYALSQDTLLMYCDMSDGSDRLLRSVDRGSSWTQMNFIFDRVTNIVSPAPGVVVAGGGFGIDGGLIYRSTNAGTTWQQIETPEDLDQISDMDVLEDGTIHAVAYKSIWRSSDLGLTWNMIYDAPLNWLSSNFGSIHFADADSGYATIGGRLMRTVNGGDCWQPEPTQLDIMHWQLEGCAPGLAFVCSSSSTFSAKQLHRSAMPAPRLQFTMNSDTVCSGSAPIVSNNSIGYDSYSWIIDGQYISSDIQPVLPHLTPGNHTIILEGTSGVNIDQFSRDLYVQVFSAIPSLSLSEPLCWAGDTVEIYATTNAPTLAYDWYLQTSTDTIQQASGGAILSVETSSFALSYFAVPVSHSGCRGMASEPMVIVASDNIPYVSAPNGTANICTWGQPLTSTYTTDPLIGATDITDYVWTLNPLVAGVMVTNGASCTISWDPNFDGNAILSCSGVDACGVGPASTAYMFVDTGNYITEQPTDIVVDVGDPLTLSIELAGPLLNNGTWFRNGHL